MLTTFASRATFSQAAPGPSSSSTLTPRAYEPSRMTPSTRSGTSTFTNALVSAISAGATWNSRAQRACDLQALQHDLDSLPRRTDAPIARHDGSAEVDAADICSADAVQRPPRTVRQGRRVDLGLVDEHERQGARSGLVLGAGQHGDRATPRGVSDRPLVPVEADATAGARRRRLRCGEVAPPVLLGQPPRHSFTRADDPRHVRRAVVGGRPRTDRPEHGLAVSDGDRQIPRGDGAHEEQ